MSLGKIAGCAARLLVLFGDASNAVRPSTRLGRLSNNQHFGGAPLGRFCDSGRPIESISVAGVRQFRSSWSPVLNDTYSRQFRSSWSPALNVTCVRYFRGCSAALNEKHPSTTALENEEVKDSDTIQREQREAEFEPDISESRRTAEIRERVVKEHKEKVAKTRFNFELFEYALYLMCIFIVIDMFELDFWDREDREKRA